MITMLESTDLESLGNKEAPRVNSWVSCGSGNRKDLMGGLGYQWKWELEVSGREGCRRGKVLKKITRNRHFGV